LLCLGYAIAPARAKHGRAGKRCAETDKCRKHEFP
jgi:hypothetical protein